MSITDELREWGRTTLMPSLLNPLLAIADRIDAEHKKACDDAWDNGYEADYLGIESWLTEHPQVMEHHGWIRLPKDADDIPWKPGDRDEDGNVVIELRLTASGWYVLKDDMRPYRPERKRHHHAPTVEDVLREFAYGLGVPVADSYVAATAAKLQLKEDA